MITARFYVAQITTHAGISPTAQIKLNPAYANGANNEWAVATPSGVIDLNVGNPAAIEQFTTWMKDGTNVHITFDAVVGPNVDGSDNA